MVRHINEQKFPELVRGYQRLVFTVCLTFTQNRFDAEDMAQETFLAAFDHLGGFDGRNPKAWLTSIAANKCRDLLRSPSHRAVALTDEEAACLEDTARTPEQTFFQKDSADSVRRLCRRLKEPYRLVAESYFCDRVKLSELAVRTGENIRTLETRLYRAKRLLRALWKEENPDEGRHADAERII